MKKHIVVVITILFLFVASGFTQAATYFLDNFGDGNTDGWSESASGTGSTGIVDNNGSLRGFASSWLLGYRSLAQTFDFTNSDILSFDMQVNANSGIEATIGGPRTRHARGGLKLSFLNTFNGALSDPVYLVYRTDGVEPPAYAGVFQGETLSSFSAAMGDYAALAGFSDISNIAKVSLEFFASSDGGGGGMGTSAAAATVWFDNVEINPVPIPAAAWLFGSGLLGMLGFARRKRMAS